MLHKTFYILYILMYSQSPKRILHPKRWKNQLKGAHNCKINEKYFQILNFEQAHETGIARVLLHGPPSTPYEGYSFQLQYNGRQIPFQPPKMIFVNIPWNPFICIKTGKICISILQSIGWSPALTLQKALVSITSLLSENKLPQFEPGLNLEAASEMKLKYSQFFRHAKQQAELRHYKKQIYYKDEQRPPTDFPVDRIKQDIDYMKQKDIFQKNPSIKSIHSKKINKILKN